jgi:hypothetical protein
MKMTSDEALWCTGTIDYFHRTISDDRRLELGLPVERKRKSATMDADLQLLVEAEEAPASKTRRKSAGSNTIVPAPPSKQAPAHPSKPSPAPRSKPSPASTSKPAPARTPPSKMAAAPRPKNGPAPSSISKTPKRKEVAPDDEDEEIEADEDGTDGDSSRRWNAGNSLPRLLFYVFCKLCIILEYSCLRCIILNYSCILLVTTYLFLFIVLILKLTFLFMFSGLTAY